MTFLCLGCLSCIYSTPQPSLRYVPLKTFSHSICFLHSIHNVIFYINAYFQEFQLLTDSLKACTNQVLFKKKIPSYTYELKHLPSLLLCQSQGIRYYVKILDPFDLEFCEGREISSKFILIKVALLFVHIHCCAVCSVQMLEIPSLLML